MKMDLSYIAICFIATAFTAFFFSKDYNLSIYKNITANLFVNFRNV